MGQITFRVQVDPMSLNIDEDKLTISVSSELNQVYFNFEVKETLCGIAISKEEFDDIAKFIKNQFDEQNLEESLDY